MKDLKTLKRMYEQIVYILAPKQKAASIRILFFSLLGAIFEMLGVSVIMPFVTALLTPQKLIENRYISFFANIFHIQSVLTLTWIIGIGICLIYILKNCFLLFVAYVKVKFQSILQKDLSVAMLQSYMKRPYTYFLNVNTAEILRGINTDVQGVYVVLDNVFKIISELLAIALIGAFIIVTDTIMALAVLIVVGTCMVGVTLFLKKRSSYWGKVERKYSMLRAKNSYEAITGIKEIFIMRREAFYARQYEKIYEQQTKATISFNFMNYCPEKIIETVCIGGIILIVCAKVSIGVDASEFIVKLAAFAVAAMRILPSVARTIGYFNGLVFYRPMLEAIYNAMREVELYTSQIKQLQQNECKKDIQFENEIVLADIFWHYENRNEDVLSGLNLRIHKGEFVGLMGPSGAGKTTVSDVILGLLRPQKGTVEMDGVDIFSIPYRWSQLIGYVPQTVFLIDDTIRNNVCFGLEENDIDDDLVWAALEQAQLSDFVQSLPEGLNTLVGERGIKFSGGQRQRMSIARALYYDPDILVLDEATSALDSETEKAVMAAIENLKNRKTLIIVAHRLSTLEQCNTIYEINSGKATLRKKEEIFGVNS